MKLRNPTAKTLNEFIQQFHWGENLIKDKALSNLEDGLVEIVDQGQHSSNGLLITNSGYFLTARHCVLESKLEGRSIRLANGRLYPIKEVWANTSKSDIALARADIPVRDSESKQYKLYNTNTLNKSIKYPVVLITRRSGEVKKSYGFIRDDLVKVKSYTGDTYCNHFELNISSQPGDSGGIVVSQDGRLVGFLSTNNESYRASCAKIIEGMEQVHSHIMEINSFSFRFGQLKKGIISFYERIKGI